MRDRAVMEAFGKGLSLLPASESVIRIAPPLIMERQDVDAGLEILGEVLRNQSRT
jgi:4-aminobutyrate aminotransferase-like enzyme